MFLTCAHAHVVVDKQLRTNYSSPSVDLSDGRVPCEKISSTDSVLADDCVACIGSATSQPQVFNRAIFVCLQAHQPISCAVRCNTILLRLISSRWSCDN